MQDQIVVQLRKFDEHVSGNGCAIPMNLIDDEDDRKIKKMKIIKFNTNKNKRLKMASFMNDNCTFYFLCSYLATKKCFIFSLMLPDDVETASKYKARITVILEDAVCMDEYVQRTLTYEGPVIEDLPNIDDDKAKLRYWFVALDAMEHFPTDNDDSSSILIQEEVLKIVKKRKRV